MTEYLKALFIGGIEGFLKIIPTSLIGHEKVYYYTNTQIASNGPDTLVPLIISLAVILSGILFIRKDLKYLFDNLIITSKDILNKKFNINEEDTGKKIILIIFFATISGILYPILANIYKDVGKNMLIISVAFLITGFMLITLNKIKGKRLNGMLSGFSLGILKVLSVVVPGLSGTCGMLFASKECDIKEERIPLIVFTLLIIFSFATFIKGIFCPLVIYYNIFYYIIIFSASFITAYFGFYLTNKAFSKNKTKYFAYYNILIAILVFLIWLRG